MSDCYLEFYMFLCIYMYSQVMSIAISQCQMTQAQATVLCQMMVRTFLTTQATQLCQKMVSLF